MICNAAGIALIKSFENCRLVSYLDIGKKWTIGWGHRDATTGPGQSCTQQQADAWFVHDIATVANQLSRIVKVPLTDNQFSALVSLTYNLGIGRIESSLTLKLLNQKNYKVVPNHMLLWNRVDGVLSSGLIRRRKAEVALWNTP